MKFKILHTNDIHGHLEHWPVIKQFIQEKQQSYQEQQLPYLTIDIGDAMDTVHPMVEASAGQIMVECFNSIPYDMVTLGNNEGLNFTQEELSRQYQNAKFDILISNLLNAQTGKAPDWAHTYQIRSVGKLNIAFFALTAPYKTYTLNGYTIIQPMDAIEAVLEKIKRHPSIDMIILLSHLGLPTDRSIATAFPEIALVLGAHTHHVLFEGELVGSTLLAAAGRYGDYVGEVTIDIDEENTIHSEAIVHSTSQLAKNYGIDISNDCYYKEGQQLLKRKIVGHLSHPYYALDKTSSNSFIQLALEAISWATDVELAMLNTGLFLIDLPSGNVSKKSLHEALPHPMHLARLTLSGEQLLEMLYEIDGQVDDLQFKLINGLGFRGKIFGEVVYKGIAYDSVSYQWLVHGLPIDKTKEYQLITVDHLWFLPFFPTISKYANPQLIFPDFLRHVVEKYIRHISENDN